jgi:hypothetical protein
MLHSHYRTCVRTFYSREPEGKPQTGKSDTMTSTDRESAVRSPYPISSVRRLLGPWRLVIVEAGAAALRENPTRKIEHWLAAGAAWEALYDSAKSTQAAHDAVKDDRERYRRYLWGKRGTHPPFFYRYLDLCDDICGRLELSWPELANIDRRTHNATRWLFKNRDEVLAWLNSERVRRYECDHWSQPTTIRERWELAHSPSPEERRRNEEEQRRLRMILSSPTLVRLAS